MFFLMFKRFNSIALLILLRVKLHFVKLIVNST